MHVPNLYIENYHELMWELNLKSLFITSNAMSHIKDDVTMSIKDLLTQFVFKFKIFHPQQFEEIYACKRAKLHILPCLPP